MACTERRTPAILIEALHSDVAQNSIGMLYVAQVCPQKVTTVAKIVKP